MFVGRRSELEFLNQRFDSGEFELIVISGRRRIGKSTLLTEFCKGKKSLYYMAQEQNDSLALADFSEEVAEVFPEVKIIGQFASWKLAFNFFGQVATTERAILVIDEFPYLVSGNNNLLSLLQKLIDQNLKHTKLFIVLCGSSVSFMENEVLAYKSPLFGRRTGQLKIKPFDYYEAADFCKSMNDENKFIAYSVLGGVPQYLQLFSKYRDAEFGIVQEILQKGALLHDETDYLLRQELRETAVYNSIIEAIATGASKYNEIATKSAVETSSCAKYLNVLSDLGIVQRETPFGEKESARKSIYYISENFFKFWYRFVFKKRSMMEIAEPQKIFTTRIKPDFDSYLGACFEQICKQYLQKQSNTGNELCEIAHLGRWWGADSRTKLQSEIDIVGSDETNDKFIFAECKWHDGLIKKDVLELLIERSAVFNFKQAIYIVFARKGFSVALKNMAAELGNVQLVSLRDLYEKIHANC